MEVKEGYKQTDVGVIPEDWEVKPIGDFFSISVGRDLKEEFFSTFQDAVFNYPVFSNTVSDEGLYGYYNFPEYSGESLTIVGRGVGLGTAFKRKGGYGAIGRLLVLFPKENVNTAFVTEYINHRVKIFTESGGIPQLTGISIAKYRIPLPPTLTEQEAIAEALSDADAFIEAVEQLLAKKRQVKQGAMQELLMGKKRLPGFSRKWEEKKIEEIAFPSSEKNSGSEPLTVLTCSKHLGFVNSLSYFKNQVFSRDTSGYKIIRRGQIGYPSNHIEEGSIGLQDLYDVALVSPIYIVFSVFEGVNSYFLHRLLKLDAYRQKFDTATTASIDRRGSLRWKAFSQITVNLPSIAEQTAIAEILSDMDAEITALEGKLVKSRQVKAGMMSELLGGKIRLNRD